MGIPILKVNLIEKPRLSSRGEKGQFSVGSLQTSVGSKQIDNAILKGKFY